MTRRYYVPDLPPAGGAVQLPSAEAQHAIRVMRVSAGDPIILFDGQGREANATIDSTGRNACLCNSEAARKVDRELAQFLHLAIALPKPDRAREMIERLTEIGVARVTPLVAERSQRPPSDSVLSKLDRAVIEACKQCCRNQLLEISPLTNATNFFQQDHDGECLIADPCEAANSEALTKPSTGITVAIGPEGGFSDDETRLATENGFERVGLGSRIYRVETAATVIASIVSVGGLK
jgi:16S rRNA (uracil1498-N3)-methyltransferase